MAKGTSTGGGLMGSWGAGGGANLQGELSRAGLTPAQANSLGVNIVGPGQTPTSGVLGGLSNLTSGATQGLYGNQGPGLANAALQTLGGIAGSRIMGGNPALIGLQGIGNMASQVPAFQGLSDFISPISMTGPATTSPPPPQTEPRGRILGRHEGIAGGEIPVYPGVPKPGPGEPATTSPSPVTGANPGFRRHGSLKEVIQAYFAGTTKG